MAGPLKTFMTMLRASAYLAGVSVAFGEEAVHDQSLQLPLIVVVPIGGPVESDGYSKGSNPDVEAKWKLPETIDVHCWSYSSSPTALPEDHADAIESLLVLVLSAFQDQRANQGFDGQASGLHYEPNNGRWEQMQGAFNRYGRGYTLSLVLEKTYAMAPPPSLTNPTLSLTVAITT